MSSITRFKPDLKKIVAVSFWLIIGVTGFTAAQVHADACGDGLVEPTEQCDDNNLLDGDGCSSACQVEAGYLCSGSPSVCAIETNPCTPGNYWNGAACVDAAAGYYVPDAAANEQTPCALGSYQPDVGSMACLPAPAGFFVDATAAISSTPCSEGTYQPNTNSASCLPVPAGSFSSAASAVATECSPGSYQPIAQQASCILASAGFFVSTTGATSQTACAAGTYSAIGASICSIAGFPSYPNPASAGQPALASDINENFDALLSAINQLNARVSALEPKPVSVIGTYDFVNMGAQISSDASSNSHISNSSGKGYFTFSDGGVITGTSIWSGSNININNTVKYGSSIGSYSHITTSIQPDSGSDSFSGTYSITGSSISVSFGEGPISGTVSPDGKIIILTLHDSDDGILIAIRR